MTVELPTYNVLIRTLWIRCAGEHGTAFTLELDENQYVVTAAHVLAPHAIIEVYLDDHWRQLNARRISPDPDYLDIAILGIDEAITPSPSTYFGVEGSVLGQDLFVLGFPFEVTAIPDLLHHELGGPLPMVKGGRLAAMLNAPGPGRNTMLVDCYANEGFSGGPVVGFVPKGGETDVPPRIAILGVVSHYVPEHQPVVNVRGRTALSAQTNPGTLVAYSIQHVIDGILASPTP